MQEHNQSKLSSTYAGHSENFRAKRYQTTATIRSRVHQLMAESVVSLLSESPDPSPRLVGDIGCGDGYITELLAEICPAVVGTDISAANISAANCAKGADSAMDFVVSDACSLPFDSAGIEVSVSHHVLEHLASFHDGLRELKRVTSRTIIVAVPSPLSPLSWCVLGGGNYWSHGRRGLLFLFRGLARTVAAAIRGDLAVDEERYADIHGTVPHYFFFPSRLGPRLEDDEWCLREYRAQVVGIPWISQRLVRPGRSGSRWGYGTIFVLVRRDEQQCVS